MMNTIFRLFIVFSILSCATWVRAEDMRELQIQAREALQQKANAEEEEARAKAEASLAAISRDRAALEGAIQKAEAENKALKKSILTLEKKEKRLEKEEKALAEKLAETDSVIRELVGVIRVNAKDIDGLIGRNLQTALSPERTSEKTAFLAEVAGQSRFPGMAEIERMVEILKEEIRISGNVRLSPGEIIDRSGNTVTADLLILGNFTAAYRLDDEVGFLSYSPAGRKLFALSKLPSSRLQKELKNYMAGKSDTVPMDITRGGGLSRLTHEMDLSEQIGKGGPLVWPILAILVAGLVIVVERLIFLIRKRLDADALARTIETLAVKKQWKACSDACARLTGKPVARVLAAGLACCHMSREAMENALQEAILREVPVMERFLSTLGMLAAIAPLLGLLGTVTGMIDTFQVITLHGTGDPRMMSGGISEALVTTMLGLSVAIPIMLAHTLLNREVDKRIGQMEEKAVALVNIVFKSRDGAA